MSQTLTRGQAATHEATAPRGRGALEGAALVLVFSALYLLAFPWLLRAWAWGLQAGIDALNLNALLTRQTMPLPWGLPTVTRLSLVGPAAEVGLWAWLLQALTLVLAHVGLKRLARMAPPLASMGAWVLALYAASLVWWALWPQLAPQHLAEHTGDLFTFGVALQCLVPLALGLTYFPIEGRLPLRVAAVALVTGYFVVCLPFKMLAHAWLVGHLGGAALPVLALCFGPVLDVLLFVALFAWLASWGAQED
jgi:hypothetical protein